MGICRLVMLAALFAVAVNAQFADFPQTGNVDGPQWNPSIPSVANPPFEPVVTSPPFVPNPVVTSPPFVPNPVVTSPPFVPNPVVTSPPFVPNPVVTSPPFVPTPSGSPSGLPRCRVGQLVLEKGRQVCKCKVMVGRICRVAFPLPPPPPPPVNPSLPMCRRNEMTIVKRLKVCKCKIAVSNRCVVPYAIVAPPPPPVYCRGYKCPVVVVRPVIKPVVVIHKVDPRPKVVVINKYKPNKSNGRN